MSAQPIGGAQDPCWWRSEDTEPPGLMALPPLEADPDDAAAEVLELDEVAELRRSRQMETAQAIPPDWRQAWPAWEAMSQDEQLKADRWWIRFTPDERRHWAERIRDGESRLEDTARALGFPTPAEYFELIGEGRGRADIHSGTGDAPAAEMIFRTARDLFAAAPAETRWACHGLVPRGGIAELDGPAKRAGKTSWMAALARCVLDGAPFLGRATEAGPVVLLSEQPVASLRASLAPWALLERGDLWILTWGDAIGRPWRDVAAEALTVAEAAGAVLLVVDTLPQWAGLRGDAENDAGAALEALAPLQRAAAVGLGVLVVRHDRKGSGEVGESARGSTAFGGAVDVIMQLRRGGQDERPTVRYLSALSRFPETPGELVIDLTPDGYQVIGDAAGYARAEAKRKVLEVIGDRELRRADVEDLAGVSGERLTEALADLVDGGYLERTGRGVKGDPQRFRRIVPIHSGGAPTTWAPPNGMNAGPTAASDDALLDRYADQLEGAT